MTLDLNRNDFPDPKADDPVFQDPNRVADKRRGQLTMEEHTALLSDVRGTGIGDKRERRLRPVHMKKAGDVNALERRPAVLPIANPYLWVEECVKVKCPGSKRPVWKPLEVDKTVIPGLHLTYVCPHGTFPQGKSCSACIVDAERRLVSIVAGRYKFMNETPAENSVNKVAWWSVGAQEPVLETFVVDSAKSLRRKLARKIEFKEDTLLCLAFETRIFWNLVRVYCQPGGSSGGEATLTAGGSFTTGPGGQRGTSGFPAIDHKLRKHFRLYRDEAAGKFVPELVKKTLRTVFLTDEDYREFEEFAGERVHGAAGEDVDKTGRFAWSALHIACQRGETRVVQILLGLGADVHATDTAGYGPLHYACLYGHREVALLLRKKGADIFQKNREGNTCIDLLEVGGFDALRKELERKVSIHAEALFLARRFYRHLMCGSVDHHDPAIRGTKFNRGRLMALILVKKPLFFKMTKAVSDWTTPDLDDLQMVGEKALGFKWDRLVTTWDYTYEFKAGKLGVVSMRIFDKGRICGARDLAEKLKKGSEDYAAWKALEPGKPVTQRIAEIQGVHGLMSHPLKLKPVSEERKEVMRDDLKKDEAKMLKDKAERRTFPWRKRDSIAAAAGGGGHGGHGGGLAGGINRLRTMRAAMHVAMDPKKAAAAANQPVGQGKDTSYEDVVGKVEDKTTETFNWRSKEQQRTAKMLDGTELFDADTGELRTEQLSFHKIGGGVVNKSKNALSDEHLEKKAAKTERKRMRRDGELPPKADEYK